MMPTTEQINIARQYADERAHDGTLEEWLRAFCWYMGELQHFGPWMFDLSLRRNGASSDLAQQL